MAKTKSILDEDGWKQSFGILLELLKKEQNIAPKTIAQHLDGLSRTERHSRSKGRGSDWWRYVNDERIPTEAQLKPLATALKISLPVLRLCAGYLDDVFECVYAATTCEVPDDWTYPIGATAAAMALLFSLFPRQRDMHIGRRSSVAFWIHGNIVRLNLSPEEGFKTGSGWNAIWLYPVRDASYLLHHHESPEDPGIVFVGEPRTTPWTWYSLRAILQVDLGSELAKSVLSYPRNPIPKTSLLCEAQQILHRKALPLDLRLDIISQIIHRWADKLNRDLAAEIREHLHPWDQRTITDEASQWIRGDLIRSDLSTIDDPHAPRQSASTSAGFAWEADGRPQDFWA